MNGKLDSNLLGGFAIDGPSGSNIKSMQSGTYTLTSTNGTVTISNVDLTKAFLIFSYTPSSADTSAAKQITTGVLTNSTTITFTANSVPTGTLITWQVIEFNNVKSNQRGSIGAPTSTTQNITISNVNPSKCLYFISLTSAQGGTSAGWVLFSAVLSSSTNFLITWGNNYGAVLSCNWQIIEFN